MKTIFYALVTLATTAWALTPEGAGEILFIKQEEKLARDVYQNLGEAWGTVVFLNIQRSEQRHMDAVDDLITQYGLTDLCPLERGVFTIPALQELYDTLMLKGLKSEKDALEVGVLIEVTDIEDLERMVAEIDDTSVVRVLENLLRGSYNHLDAFNGALENGTGPSLRQQRAGGGQARFSWEGGNESLGEPQAASMVIERSVAGSDVWTTVMDVTGLSEAVIAVDSLQNVLHRLRMETNAAATQAQQGSGPNGGGQNSNLGTGPVAQVVYSNVLSTLVLDSPWPDAAWAGSGWYDTWEGWMEVSYYPWSFNPIAGWSYVIATGEKEAWAWSRDEGWSFTAASVYPWVYLNGLGWRNTAL